MRLGKALATGYAVDTAEEREPSAEPVPASAPVRIEEESAEAQRSGPVPREPVAVSPGGAVTAD